MPPPAKIAILPFIKELIFNKQPVMEYIKRNKLITGLFIAVVILVFVNLFITEQAIRLSNASQNNTRNPLLEQEILRLKNTLNGYANIDNDLALCRSELLISKTKKPDLLTACPDKPNTPTSPTRSKEVFIQPRGTADDSLRRKLDAIRIE